MSHDYPACALYRGGRCTCDEADKNQHDTDHVLMGGAIRIPANSRVGKEPCGECYIQPGETCDRCGAKGASGVEDKRNG